MTAGTAPDSAAVSPGPLEASEAAPGPVSAALRTLRAADALLVVAAGSAPELSLRAPSGAKDLKALRVTEPRLALEGAGGWAVVVVVVVEVVVFNAHVT